MPQGKKLIIRAVLIANVVLLGMISGGVWQFGSIPKAMGYLRGERLFAERSLLELGRISPGEHRTIEYRIRNTSDRPVRILGAKSSCTCAHVVNVPMEIAAGATESLKFDVHPGSSRSSADGIFHAFTDHPKQPILVLKLTATVSKLGPRHPITASANN